ncbi:TonB-dependent receptor [uncultured Campylobacter sp.]|uniref:TonB-dependent receptor n=1 Tax=uncultured Campylobacter sp. TaxID=218934 RepID=UPI00260F338D|nr:Plug domain-containing protein [uncultured Campylobacter sp.]
MACKKSDTNIIVLDEQKLQRDEIKRLSEVAYSTPGVYVDKKGPRAEQNFYVRGFDARRVPLYIDGIPVYVPYDGNADFGRFTTFDLSQINISKGSSSVLYGPNTMGGAINLITKNLQKSLKVASVTALRRAKTPRPTATILILTSAPSKSYFTYKPAAAIWRMRASRCLMTLNRALLATKTAADAITPYSAIRNLI